MHQADLADIPYSNYFANLIVSDSLLLDRQASGVDPTPSRVISSRSAACSAWAGRQQAPGDDRPADQLDDWLATRA